jgi:hypothetical protein
MAQICTKCDNCGLFVIGECKGLEKFDLKKCAEMKKKALRR